jgi:hypothetical protein
MICIECKRDRKKYAKSLCNSCYDRINRKKGKCVDCGGSTYRSKIERCQSCRNIKDKQHKGRLHSQEVREKIRNNTPVKRGSGHPMWKGGITPINALLRHLPKYRAWREKVFARDNYTCQMCLDRGGRLEANHIKRFVDFPEIRHEVTNGITLCVSCHNKTKGKERLFEVQFSKITGFQLP